jgi:hypothetical protein
MQPTPDQPPAQGEWVHIEHPEHGRAENPVHRSALGVWAKQGWTEAKDDQPVKPPAAVPTPAKFSKEA